MNPKRINASFKSHGNYWATKISESGHSLDDKREIFHHDGCFPKAPNIFLTFSNSEMTWAASGGKTTYHVLVGGRQEMHCVGIICGIMTHLLMLNFLFVCT